MYVKHPALEMFQGLNPIKHVKGLESKYSIKGSITIIHYKYNYNK